MANYCEKTGISPIQTRDPTGIEDKTVGLINALGVTENHTIVIRVQVKFKFGSLLGLIRSPKPRDLGPCRFSSRNLRSDEHHLERRGSVG